MNEALTQYGFAGIICYILIRESFGLIKGRMNGKNGNGNGSGHGPIEAHLASNDVRIDALSTAVYNMQATVSGLVATVDRGLLPRIERIESTEDRRRT